MLQPRFTTRESNKNDNLQQNSARNKPQLFEDMRAAMQEFVDRVDKGEITSKYHYRKFKEILSSDFQV